MMTYGLLLLAGVWLAAGASRTAESGHYGIVCNTNSQPVAGSRVECCRLPSPDA